MKMVWIIIATALIVTGCVIFAVAFAANDFNFVRLFNVEYQTNTYEIDESFDDIVVDIDTADVKFIPSNDGKCKVVCYENPDVTHSVTVEEGALNIKLLDTRRWYEKIGVNIGNYSISVYLPQSEYKHLKLNNSTGDVDLPDAFSFETVSIKVTTGDVACKASCNQTLKIESGTGNINVEGSRANELTLSVSTGEIAAKNITCGGTIGVYVSTGKSELKNIKCKKLITDGTTGDISMFNVIADESFSITRGTGEVLLSDCDAGEISVKTTTGDVKGSICSSKIFIVTTSTGKINVPESTTGGKCKISTSTGDVSIKIK